MRRNANMIPRTGTDIQSQQKSEGKGKAPAPIEREEDSDSEMEEEDSKVIAVPTWDAQADDIDRGRRFATMISALIGVLITT